ncbi:MAG: bacterial Ig-like domain-containing protein, partial [Salinivirgaceae bacterium]|nr:bacterial Ig-like domain-containing protein [Salinivirgaceae bacterium]
VVTFSNGTTKEIALSAAMVSGFDAKKVGEQKLTVTYTVDGVTLTTTFTVKVEKNTAVDDEAVAEVSIYAINRTIVVETAEPAAGYVFVFDANGRLVAKELATSNRTEIAMTRQGLYIVRIGDKAERVVVY